MDEGESSVSVVRPMTYKLTHTMEVDRFEDVVATFPTGVSIRGDDFRSQTMDPACRFYVNLYPNGSRLLFQGWLSVFVHLRPTNTVMARTPPTPTELTDMDDDAGGDAAYNGDIDYSNVSAVDTPQALPITQRHCAIKFSVLDSNDNEVLSRSAAHTLTALPGNQQQTYSSGIKTNWGFRRFCNPQQLVQSTGGETKLRIRCQITVSSSTLNDSSRRGELNVDAWFSAIAAFLRSNDDRLTDFTIYVPASSDITTVSEGADLDIENERTDLELQEVLNNYVRIPVHRLVLAAHSPVFRTMFESAWSVGSKDYVVLHDCDDVTFRAFLRFLYEGPTTQPEQNGGVCAIEATMMLLALLKLADKYMVDSLQHFCEQRLQDIITAETAALVLSEMRPYWDVMRAVTLRAAWAAWADWATFSASASWRQLLADDGRAAAQLLVDMHSLLLLNHADDTPPSFWQHYTNCVDDSHRPPTDRQQPQAKTEGQ